MRAIVHVQRLRVLAEIEVKQRQVPPVVKGEAVVRRPVLLARVSQSMPSRSRPCISITCVTACTAQGSRD